MEPSADLQKFSTIPLTLVFDLANQQSQILLDNLRLLIMPFTFKSSIIVWFSLTSLWLTLCKWSFLILAIFKSNRASLRCAFSLPRLPLIFRDKALARIRRFFSSVRYGLIFGKLLPSEHVWSFQMCDAGKPPRLTSSIQKFLWEASRLPEIQVKEQRHWVFPFDWINQGRK